MVMVEKVVIIHEANVLGGDLIQHTHTDFFTTWPLGRPLVCYVVSSANGEERKTFVS